MKGVRFAYSTKGMNHQLALKYSIVYFARIMLKYLMPNNKIDT